MTGADSPLSDGRPSFESPDGRPSLLIGPSAEMVDWVTDFLGFGPLAGMFRRGDDIVYTPRIGESGYLKLTEDERDNDGPAQVRPMSTSRIASFIQLRYWCHKAIKLTDEDGEPSWVAVPAMFPKDAARPAVDHPAMQPRLRLLRGVTHTPLPRADGTVLDAPGYDPATRLLYLPAAGLSVEQIPERPTADQVAEALKLLRWLVQDFAFLTEHDEANYLGLMLTPLLREIAPPPYKLGAIGAPQPGSGKSLLAALLRTLHGGVFRSEVPPDEAEMRKAITTVLDVTTGPVIQLDNCSGVLRSSVLAGLLTSGTWEDRRLGSNHQMRGRNDRLWVLTGNNLSLGGDLVRRSVWVTIDPHCPDPHLRTDFTVPDLEGYVREHRGEVLAALLTLVRNWVVAGKPTTPRGGDSYARWLETVSGILTTAGHPGVFDHRKSARQTVGEDDSEWKEFLEAVHDQFGDLSWTVKELLGKFTPKMERSDDGWPVRHEPELPLDALPAELAEKAARSPQGITLIGKSLGRWLMNRDGRWAGDLTIRRDGDSRGGVARWKVQRHSTGSHRE